MISERVLPRIPALSPSPNVRSEFPIPAYSWNVRGNLGKIRKH